jgi:hypothetical protein
LSRRYGKLHLPAAVIPINVANFRL